MGPEPLEGGWGGGGGQITYFLPVLGSRASVQAVVWMILRETKGWGKITPRGRGANPPPPPARALLMVGQFQQTWHW